MLYNFRFDRSSIGEVLRRLRDDKVLAQGWGGGDTADLSVHHDDFVSRTVAAYDLRTTRIPTNLTRMRAFRDGDLIVTPHLPEHGLCAVHVVDGDFPGCYQYKAGDTWHLNHQIRIRASHGLDGNISIYNALLASWYGKLQWLRLPILPIPQFLSVFQSALQQISTPGTAGLPASALDEYLQQLRESLLASVRGQLLTLSPSNSAISFEAVCERLLAAGGYEIQARNQYNSQGGDVDLRCVRSRAAATPFEVGDVVLLVQIKKHSQVTDDHAVRQLLPMLQSEPQADGCVMSLSDGYTTEAEKLAASHGIALLTATEICDQVLSLVATPAGAGSQAP